MDRYTLIVVLQIFVGLCATFVSLAMALGPTGWSLIVTIISLGKRKIIAVDKIDEIQETQKNVVYTTINNNNSLFMGFFIGKHSSGEIFVGYDTTDAKTKSRTLYIVLSRTTLFFDITKKEVDHKPNNEYRKYDVSGCSNYCNNVGTSTCSYKEEIIADFEQTNLLNDINTKMGQKRDKHKIVTAFIYGAPKTGKSSICDLILLEQREHNPIYVRLNLFALGQTFQIFKDAISNSTVIVIDLGDIGEILKDDFKNLTKSELFNRIVNTKSDWNNFFDDFDREQYVGKEMYVIATSNVDVKDMDSSYTRPGRFDICREFSTTIN